MGDTKRPDLEEIFRAGVAACHPATILPPHLPQQPRGRAIVLALGKGAASMAKAVEDVWPGPISGLAVTPAGTPDNGIRIALINSGHPVPDSNSVQAAQRLLALAESAGPDDLVLFLLSGGASALACLPSDGLALAEKQALTSALLRSGAPIADINCVRRHLSRFKGGRLAAAAQPARIVTLAISDVVGDAPEDIGSGPSAADPTTIDDAREILRRYGIPEPRQGWSESVKPAAAAQWRSNYRIVAQGRDAVDAAAIRAASLGYEPIILEYDCEGEARDAAGVHAARALRVRKRTALISGGELTVTKRGSGRGGPNQEYALALAIALGGARDIHALAGDTDGIDGIGNAAGAFVDPGTIARAHELGIDPAEALHDNSSGDFFAALGDLVVTGPTGTNVNDLRVILVDP